MRTALAALIIILSSLAAPFPNVAGASDHYDGEHDAKSRSLNLTDLYVFREGDQTGVPEDASKLIFVMNTNPLSLARQRYFFSTTARYEFLVSRRASRTDPVTGAEDIILRFAFGAPDGANQQRITVTAILDGQAVSTATTTEGTPILTTPLTFPATSPINNAISIAGTTLAVFAGLREDPFFFDAEQYAKVRAGLLGSGPGVGFRTASNARDCALGHNVNAIVLRAPISFLQGPTAATTFDVWETISIPKGQPNERKRFTQVERLGRPLINQGLVVSNDHLNAFNSIRPTEDLGPGAAPILVEAKATVTALGNAIIPSPPSRAQSFLDAYLPDVMRIDTTIVSPVGTWAYGSSAVPFGGGPNDWLPVAGRKIEDDVVDFMLTILANGSLSDNVSYRNPASPLPFEHKLLNGQAVFLGPATFPFLAEPN